MTHEGALLPKCCVNQVLRNQEMCRCQCRIRQRLTAVLINKCGMVWSNVLPSVQSIALYWDCPVCRFVPAMWVLLNKLQSVSHCNCAKQLASVPQAAGLKLQQVLCLWLCTGLHHLIQCHCL